jgi:hypothetical protein
MSAFFPCLNFEAINPTLNLTYLSLTTCKAQNTIHYDNHYPINLITWMDGFWGGGDRAPARGPRFGLIVLPDNLKPKVKNLASSFNLLILKNRRTHFKR